MSNQNASRPSEQIGNNIAHLLVLPRKQLLGGPPVITGGTP